jgi:hypothetical protein
VGSGFDPLLGKTVINDLILVQKAELAAAITDAVKSLRHDYEEVLSSYRDLVHELDELLNGAGAAKQASLCDIVSQVRSENIRSKYFSYAKEAK